MPKQASRRSRLVRPWHWRIPASAAHWLAIAALCCALAAVTWYESNQRDAQTACFNTYASQLSAALNGRNPYARALDRAQQQLAAKQQAFDDATQAVADDALAFRDISHPTTPAERRAAEAARSKFFLDLSNEHDAHQDESAARAAANDALDALNKARRANQIPAAPDQVCAR